MTAGSGTAMRRGAKFDRYLTHGDFVDSDKPDIVAMATRTAAGAKTDTEKAVRLYYAVRDGLPYDPYAMGEEKHWFRASDCLRSGKGFCIPKAALLAALCRAVGIPARVAYADVKNHLTTEKLRSLMDTDLFAWHGCTEIWLPDPATDVRRWVKATPAFNLALCEKFGVKPLEFDGSADSLFHEYDRAGRRHMEYVADRGAFADVPYETILADFRAMYPALLAALEAGRRGNFAAEAERGAALIRD